MRLTKACKLHRRVVLLSFFIAVTFSTHSFAYSSHTLTRGSWSLISIPADPGGNTLEALFGDDLPADSYGPSGSWIMYAFNASENVYNIVNLNDSLSANTGYWIVQDVEDSVELDVPDSLRPPIGDTLPGCTAGTLCTNKTLVGKQGAGQWNLVGVSLDSPSKFSDTRFQLNDTVCRRGCTLAQAEDENLLASAIYAYDGQYKLLTEASEIQPWSGIWMPILTNSPSLQWLVPIAATSSNELSYDIVYVRQPRYGDSTNTVWPEVTRPGNTEPGADLMLLHPDGSEEVLVAGGNGAVTDPVVSFDAQWVYYSYFHDVRPESLNIQRNNLSFLGADIFRINIASREIEQLTSGEFTPNTAAGVWDESNPLNPGAGFNRLGYGVLNLGPMPLPNGKIMFSSNRNAFVPPRGFTTPTLQLFVMDENGDNVTQVGHFNLSGALHPTILRDGRVVFSTLETQGVRSEGVWGLWSMNPDGTNWNPVVSAFAENQVFHFVTQLSNEDLVVNEYYNQNNNGFGALHRLPLAAQGEVAFNGPTPEENTGILHTVMAGDAPYTLPITISFSPIGMYSITPFTTGGDSSAPFGSDGARVGKFTHPSGAPNRDLLAVWTPGPANHQNGLKLPAYDGGLYVVPGGDIMSGPEDLKLIKNDPAYNEAWPRALVPYIDVHGVEQPATLPFLPNDGSQHELLPAGSPHALIGASSLIKRGTAPGNIVSWSDTFDGLDPFNTAENGASSNWQWQGADAGKYSDADIWAVRIVAMEPNTHRSYGPQDIFEKQFKSFAGERLRILGEIPVRKFDGNQNPILDPEGNPDTSFLAKIPADTPFTFQTIDRNAMVLNMAQTWHQLRPGEVRTDCGGCHAHSEAPLEFSQTAAAQADYEIYDLNQVTPMLNKDENGVPTLDIVNSPLVDVEFLQDIRPLLNTNCVSCHTGGATNPPGQLVLDDLSTVNSTHPGFNLPGDYARLAADENAQWGYPPIIENGIWRQTNASRYVRKFQSRRSLLSWKLFGERLDGWENSDHPTETVLGNPLTFTGDDLNDGDIDYTGSIMPPANVPQSLSYAEKMTVARWIDLGAPIELDSTYGWFFDDLRPTLTISSPHPDYSGPTNFIRFGVSDANSGIAENSISVTADTAIMNRPPNSELIDLFSSSDQGIYSLNLGVPLNSSQPINLNVEVADRQGNITRVKRTFSSIVEE